MKIDSGAKRRVATVGTFDGLHRGHLRVLEKLKAIATERGLEPMVICFDRHPLETIAPQRAPMLVQSPSERTNSLYGQGISLFTLEFTPEMASLSAEEWLRKMHSEQRVDVLVVGYDNTFGHDGVNMNISDYTKLGAKIGIEVVAAPYEPGAGSSAIRRLLEEGDIEGANHLLGRSFSIIGTVEEGKRLGASLGFPTANIHPGYRALMPKNGVYVVDVELPDGQCRKGVANIGVQPSVADDAPVRLEVHIPQYTEDLYGKRLVVRFLCRLRDEKKFDSIKELRAQISRDVKSISKIIK